MALAYIINKLEDVAEGLRALYVKMADGRYQLEVDGAVDKSKVDEFRNKNIELLKEAEKFKDLNPQKYQELMDLQRQREEKALLDAGEVDKVVNNRVTAMRQEYEANAAKLAATNTSMSRQLETLMIDNTVRAIATKTGVRAEAVDDVLLRAKNVFKIHEGQVVALDNEGKVVYGKDGTTPLNPEEWATGLKATAPHLYMSSQGGGASNGAGGGGFSGSGQKLNATGKIAAGIAAGGFDGDA